MISGIGIDIEEVKRFKEMEKKENFLKFVFTEEEIKYCNQKKEPHRSFAGKFCAKEAVIKACPEHIHIQNIEIINLDSGKIYVKLNGKVNKKIKCSISHTKDLAMAFVIIDA